MFTFPNPRIKSFKKIQINFNFDRISFRGLKASFLAFASFLISKKIQFLNKFRKMTWELIQKTLFQIEKFL